jgi:hypothetical protein
MQAEALKVQSRSTNSHGQKHPYSLQEVLKWGWQTSGFFGVITLLCFFPEIVYQLQTSWIFKRRKPEVRVSQPAIPYSAYHSCRSKAWASADGQSPFGNTELSETER